MAGLMSFRDLQRIFATLDRNGDGRLSTEELSFLLNKVGVSSTGPEELKATVLGLESLDLQEFVVFYESSIKQEEEDSGERDLMEAFKVFDQNNDGFISCSELRDVLLRLGLLEEDGGGDCTRMITKFDTNSDGQLDFQEFKQMMLSQHSTIA
ncbi:hypothetical protein H6P81_001699 [Aristolochia fimbriata]|uniref:EF-hand domain-containing protein n=1 Tax=Aristolochia fimbriata TaxID=158543 RepID=A0AAV7F8T0_ARIFI|nr:hypothetical protein H6P81_001699 [Aristolochia fimbriata]